MCQKLTVDILDRLLGPVDEYYLEQDVVVVNLSDGLSIDRVRVTSELVDFLLVLALQFAHEVVGLDSTLS